MLCNFLLPSPTLSVKYPTLHTLPEINNKLTQCVDQLSRLDRIKRGNSSVGYFIMLFLLIFFQYEALVMEHFINDVNKLWGFLDPTPLPSCHVFFFTFWLTPPPPPSNDDVIYDILNFIPTTQLLIVRGTVNNIHWAVWGEAKHGPVKLFKRKRY